MQAGFDTIGNGGLARSGKAGEPEYGGPMLHQPAPCSLADRYLLMMDVGRPPQGKIDDTGSDGLIRIAVEQNERAGSPILIVGVERDRPRDGQIADALLVEDQG